MLKVLYIIDSLQTGGAESSLVSITSRFKNVRPYFIYVYPGGFYEKELKKNNIEVFSLNIDKGYRFNEALKKMLPIVHQIKPDIIHTTLFNSDIIGRKLKKEFPVLLINSFVNNSYLLNRYKNLGFINKIKLFLLQQFDRFTASNVDLFISNSEAIKKTNAKALGIPLEKIKVIHRGRDIQTFSKISPDNLKNLKTELGLKNDLIFLNVGRLLQRKGQLDLISAFKNFVDKKPQSKLLIAGDGSFKRVLQTYIKENKLGDKVLLLGNREDIPSLLQLADYFVFPSWYEGLPGSLIEAMMAKIPIVASNIPENLECVSTENALIFQKGDQADLFAKLNWAVDNRGSMLLKADKAFEFALHNFEINQISKRYEQSYYHLRELTS